MPLGAKRRTSPSISSSSIYPLHPPDSQVLVRISESDLTWKDRLLVYGSSTFLLGSVLWIPALLIGWARRKYKENSERKEERQEELSEHEKRRTLYRSLIWTAIAGLLIVGPHRSPEFGKWIRYRKWSLWKAWVRYFALTIINDNPDRLKSNSNDTKTSTTDPVIMAFMPHGIFPFSLAIAAVSEAAEQAFGIFRPIVATAVNLFPFVSDILSWTDPIDASRAQVHRALTPSTAHALPIRVGVVPGGIAEIFEADSTNNDEEHVIVRKGILRMALQHGLPVVPIYCFGASSVLAQWHIDWLERLSNWSRIALVIFYGEGGLPIPFRQKLLYVMGKPIARPIGEDVSEEMQVDEMHRHFCDEIHRLFERHKEAYGWGHKTLRLITK